MQQGILEGFRKEMGLVEKEFRESESYNEIYTLAQGITTQMQNSRVIEDFRTVFTYVREAYENSMLIGPTGHQFLVTDNTFRSAYPNFLQSYEFALLAGATMMLLK